MTIIERRRKNIEIFKNTIQTCEAHPILTESIESSVRIQRVFLEEDRVDVSMPDPNGEKARIIVSGKRTLEAAADYAKAGMRVCVLNFADWTNPGGWVLRGSSAQEESLCRCSTLYPCISDGRMMEQFYLPHKAKRKDPMHILHNDDIIYTPSVTVFKSDTPLPELLSENDWYQVDVITCAAPRLRLRSADRKKLGVSGDILEIEESKLRDILSSRIRKILATPIIFNSQNYDALILGGWGCGAFRNPPELVAELFYEQIKGFCRHYKVIEFPIYHTKRDDKNYAAFCKHINHN